MNVFQARRLLPFALCAVLLTRCSCDFFGTTGALLISEDDESRLGAEFDTHLRTNDTAKMEYPVYVANTPERTAFRDYVTGLASEILAKVPKSERPEYPFTFTLIDKDIENAFAVPGGYVYIYTGIIKKMRDESELTGVLGHEIAHVTRHHYRAAMAENAGLSLILQALIGNDAGQLTQLVAGSFFQLAALGVSRNNETDADEKGTRYTGNVGRNPMGIAKFFSRLPSQGFAWFSTHPEPEDRVGNVTAEVAKSPAFAAIAADSANTNFQTRFEANTRVLAK